MTVSNFLKWILYGWYHLKTIFKTKFLLTHYLNRIIFKDLARRDKKKISGKNRICYNNKIIFMCFKFFSWKIIFPLLNNSFNNNIAILESKIIYFCLRNFFFHLKPKTNFDICLFSSCFIHRDLLRGKEGLTSRKKCYVNYGWPLRAWRIGSRDQEKNFIFHQDFFAVMNIFC